MKKMAVPTSQELDALFALAEAGDISALNDIYDINKTLANRANSRMKYLEDQEMETAAYTRAQYWLGEKTGKSRFSKAKQSNLDALRKQMDMESQFLRWQTSTTAGEKLRRENIYKTLEEHGIINIPDDPKKARAYKKEMDKFLSSDAFENIKNSIGTDFVSIGSEYIEAGAKAKDLINLYSEYEKATNKSLFDVIDGWKEGKRHLTDR